MQAFIEKIEYEKLDEIRIKGMEKAEKKCRKLRMGKHQWSTTLQLARDKLRYTKLTLSKKMQRRVSTRLLIRLSKKSGLNYELLTEDEIKNEGEAVDQEYDTFDHAACLGAENAPNDIRNNIFSNIC